MCENRASRDCSCGWTGLALTTVGWDSGLWLLLLVGNKTVTSQPLPPLWLLFFFQVQPNQSLSHHLPNISTQMVKLKVYTAGRAPHSHWQIHPWGVSPQLVWLSFCRRETQKTDDFSPPSAAQQFSFPNSRRVEFRVQSSGIHEG